MKNHSMIKNLVIVAIACICGMTNRSLAQGESPKEMQRFKTVPGMWSGNLQGTMNGKPVKGSVRHLYRTCSAGWGVEMNETMNLDSTPAYVCVNLFGYDPGDKKMHIYSVSNFGDTHDHVGTWKDDKTLSLEYNGTLKGKPYKEKLEIVFESETSYHFTEKTMEDGKETFNASATMTKTPQPKRPEMIHPPGQSKPEEMQKDVPKK